MQIFELKEGALAGHKNQSIVFNLASVNTGVDFDIGRTQYMFEENMLLQMMPIRAAANNGVQKFIQVVQPLSILLTPWKHHIQQKNQIMGETEQSKLGYALPNAWGKI